MKHLTDDLMDEIRAEKTEIGDAVLYLARENDARDLHAMYNAALRALLDQGARKGYATLNGDDCAFLLAQLDTRANLLSALLMLRSAAETHLGDAADRGELYRTYPGDDGEPEGSMYNGYFKLTEACTDALDAVRKARGE